ncbi:phage protein [Gluconobacter frateurii M-2]|nr:phage protein [Gluconobacter frateurii M-2]
MDDLNDLLDLMGLYTNLGTDIAAFPSQIAYSESIGKANATVSSVLNGRLTPTAQFLDAAGYDRVECFRPLGIEEKAPLLNSLQFFTEVGTLIRKSGSMRAWCKKHGLPPTSVAQFLNDERSATDAIVKAAGFRRLIRYRRRATREIAA